MDGARLQYRRTAKEAWGSKLPFLPSFFGAVVSAAAWILAQLGVPSMSSWLLYLLPALVGIVATIVWLAISLFYYAHRQRVQLDGVVDLEAAINTLSAHFKEGNV